MKTVARKHKNCWPPISCVSEPTALACPAKSGSQNIKCLNQVVCMEHGRKPAVLTVSGRRGHVDLQGMVTLAALDR